MKWPKSVEKFEIGGGGLEKLGPSGWRAPHRKRMAAPLPPSPPAHPLAYLEAKQWFPHNSETKKVQSPLSRPKDESLVNNGPLGW